MKQAISTAKKILCRFWHFGYVLIPCFHCLEHPPSPWCFQEGVTTPWRPLLGVSTLSLWLWSPARMSSFFHCQGSPRSQAAAVHSLSCYEGSMWVPVVRVPCPAFRTLSALCLQHSYCTRVLPSGASQSYRLDRWQAIAELAGISQNCKNYAN